MSCPCGLSQERVLEVAEKHGVPLLGGKCQNPLADGSDGVCGKALGAHPLSLGYYYFILYDIYLIFISLITIQF